jgi:pre-mRNA-splicing factor SYF1
VDPQSLMAGIVNVYNFRSWWNAILAVPLERFEKRCPLYNRALQHLPGSYKLWYNYLKEARAYAKQFCIVSQSDYFDAVNKLHEKALEQMLYMPKIYLDYAKFLQKQHQISKVRQVYNQAL